jgi:catechol-2,3-dioxygenase
MNAGGDPMNHGMNRREFLHWSAAAFVAMHAPLLSAESAPPAPVSAQVQIRHVKLHACDLAGQAKFYREVLKLPVETGDGFVRVTAGTSVIEFVPAAAGTQPFYHFAFTIPENKLNEAMAWLEPRCPISNIRNTKDKIMVFKSWRAESFYFDDPEGNILEFIVHHDLANGSSEAFSEKHILWECEIGLVVPEVPAAEQEIEKALGLRYYIDHFPNFSGIGDIRGQLIVVQKSRVWLPTLDVHADVFPTEVTLGGAKAGTLAPGGLPYRVTIS